MVYSKKKEFAGANSFFLEYTRFQKVLDVEEGKQEVTEVVSLVKKRHKIYIVYPVPRDHHTDLCDVLLASTLNFQITSQKHAYIILTGLKPHFYIVKLGFTGVYIIFLISAKKHRLWYSLELPC